jgi:hypothetical protein
MRFDSATGDGGAAPVCSAPYHPVEEKPMQQNDLPFDDASVDARRSPFYEWLDNTAIRELVHRIQELSAGEQLVVIKGLVPGLVGVMGLAQFEAFLSEISIKARRFQEAVDHPGEGREFRVTPGEEIGGPTPSGHLHLPTARDPNHRGAREAERLGERELWRRNEDDSARPPDPR